MQRRLLNYFALFGLPPFSPLIRAAAAFRSVLLFPSSLAASDLFFLVAMSTNTYIHRWV